MQWSGLRLLWVLCRRGLESEIISGACVQSIPARGVNLASQCVRECHSCSFAMYRMSERSVQSKETSLRQSLYVGSLLSTSINFDVSCLAEAMNDWKCEYL